MIELKDGVCVFTLSAPQAQWVCVAGDFNGWSTTATPMRQVRPGLWSVALELPTGDHRFRYVTSHRGWLTDWAAFGVERNPFGDWNSVIHIPAGVAPRRKPAERTDAPAARKKPPTGIPRLIGEATPV